MVAVPLLVHPAALRDDVEGAANALLLLILKASTAWGGSRTMSRARERREGRRARGEVMEAECWVDCRLLVAGVPGIVLDRQDCVKLTACVEGICGASLISY